MFQELSRQICGIDNADVKLFLRGEFAIFIPEVIAPYTVVFTLHPVSVNSQVERRADDIFGDGLISFRNPGSLRLHTDSSGGGFGRHHTGNDV